MRGPPSGRTHFFLREGEALTGSVAKELLRWYDRHSRDLPWRVGPAARARGERPDPYRVWLSEIMLQQTTVAAVKEPFARFIGLWPTVADLAAAPREAVLSEWAGLGYYARARNLHACAVAVVDTHGGRFPETVAELLGLPGIGPYTAAAVAAIAFDRPAAAVDGNVERVVARLFAVGEPMPAAKPKLRARAEELVPTQRSGDFAQAMMDLGATVCTPRDPACGICPLLTLCEGRRAGIAAELPRKAAKTAKPARYGAAFVAIHADGSVLLDRRPDEGLLGGMLEVPGTAWGASMPDDPFLDAPITGEWRDAGRVRHSFTHFHLELQVWRLDAQPSATPKRGAWMPHEEAKGLPTVMKKALKAGLSACIQSDPRSRQTKKRSGKT